MTKIIALILLFLSFMGIVGGIGYTLYCGAWPVSVGLVAAGYVAWPRFRELFKTLTEQILYVILVMTVGYWDSNNEWQDSGYSGTDNIVDYNIYPINENDRTLTEADGCFAAGTRVHDLSTRFINMRDGVHPEFEPTRQRWAEKISKLLETYA